MPDMPHPDTPITNVGEAEYIRQRKLEEESVLLGVHRYEKERVHKDESALGPGRSLVRRSIAPLAQAIAAFVADAKTGKPGRRHTAVQWLEEFDPEELAFLTATIIVNIVPRGNIRAQSVAVMIATALEESVRYERFRKESPDLYNALQRKLKRTNSSAASRDVMRGALRDHPEVSAFALPAGEKVLIGMKLLELFIESTGVVSLYLDTSHGSRNRQTLVRPSEEILDWLEDAHARSATFMPLHMPMIVPPRPWRSSRGGGYLTNAGGELTLVRTRNRAYLRELANADMPLVYEAINRMQETPWAVNKAVLAVMEEAWEAGGGIGGLPERDLLPLPPKPDGLLADADRYKAEHPEEFKAWKRERAKVYELNARSVSKRVAALQKIAMARRFRDEHAIYFPHTLDFRGRAYPVPGLLTPQGDDAAKALLHFAEGVPLGEDGHKWLAIHIANCFGVDKVSFEERIAWVHEHTAELSDSALDPIDGQRFWTTADSPWQALAACFEWLGATCMGSEYVSHLPVALDGSCNGLQNFSAMLRDEVGGKATNLVPSEKPADIYTEVLELANKVVAQDALSGNVEAIKLDGRLTRPIVKRPVMTLPYGVTRNGMRSQLLESFKDAGLPDDWSAADYLAGVLWRCIGEVVIASRAVMDWLREVARTAASGDMPVHWTTPAGFPVLQEYREEKGRRIKTHVAGREMQFIISGAGTKLDRRRQSLGISPNFVHSCDAAHMMRTIVLAAANGIEHFAMIHDSYGTHAANAGVLAAALRHAFVEQYEGDVLGDFCRELEAQLPPDLAALLPPLPSKGTLELEQVLASPYFFA